MRVFFLRGYTSRAWILFLVTQTKRESCCYIIGLFILLSFSCMAIEKINAKTGRSLSSLSPLLLGRRNSPHQRSRCCSAWAGVLCMDFRQADFSTGWWVFVVKSEFDSKRKRLCWILLVRKMQQLSSFPRIPIRRLLLPGKRYKTLWLPCTALLPFPSWRSSFRIFPSLRHCLLPTALQELHLFLNLFQIQLKLTCGFRSYQGSNHMNLIKKTQQTTTQTKPKQTLNNNNKKCTTTKCPNKKNPE